MAITTTEVALKDVRFFAFHGFYPEEQLIGSVFYVDIETAFKTYGSAHDELAKTLNYETLFQIAQEAMNKTSRLIETVAEQILNRLIQGFPELLTIKVRIRKMNPPLPGEVGYSQVVLNWSR